MTDAFGTSTISLNAFEGFVDTDDQSATFEPVREESDPAAPPDLRLKSALMKLPYKDDRVNDPGIRSWMEERQLGVGASEIAVLFGLSPYQTLEELWDQKVNGCSYEPGPELFHWGHTMEPVIAAEFERRTGERVEDPPQMIMVGSKPHYRASLDRVIVEDGVPVAALELKNLSDTRYGEYKVGGPSVGYLLQLQYQMAVAGLDYGYLACMFGGQRWAAWRVLASPTIQAEIFERVDAFWSYVTRKEKPPANLGTRGIAERELNEINLTDPEWEKRLSTLNTLRLEKAAIEKEEKILKEQVKEVLGDCHSASAGRMEASLTYSSRKSFNKKRMEAEHPELIEKYTTENEFTRLTIRNKKS